MELSWRCKAPKIDMMKTCTSYGVILVRNITDTYKNSVKLDDCNISVHRGNIAFSHARLEALLVKGRCSYEFLEFVSGNKAKKSLHIYKTLLSQMYVYELTCILSLNFDFMWHHAWLGTNRNKEMYIQQKQRFTEYWMDDNGKILTSLIKSITPLTKNMRIEFPKGRMKNREETELVCACREVKEETGIDPSKYTIIPGLIKVVTFIQQNVRYIYKYFVGIMNIIEPVKLSLENLVQVSEISDIQWMSFDQICRIDKRRRLERIISPIFEYLTKSFPIYKHIINQCEEIDEKNN